MPHRAKDVHGVMEIVNMGKTHFSPPVGKDHLSHDRSITSSVRNATMGHRVENLLISGKEAIYQNVYLIHREHARAGVHVLLACYCA